MVSFDVNWLAILASIVANMVIGAVWYGVFAEPWLEGIGKTREEVEQEQSPTAYAVAVLNSLLMALVLANVLTWAGAASLMDGLLVAFLMWLGFTGFTFAANHAFEFRSLKLWLVNSVVYLVGSLVMGAILTLWV